MADRTTPHTKRGGARRNAGRPRVHTPGKQNSLCLGTGDEPARVLKLFREERNRRSFKHNHEFLDYLLRQLGTAQQDFVPVTTSFIRPGGNEGYGRKHTDSETDVVNLTLLTLFAGTSHNGDAATHGDCPPESIMDSGGQSMLPELAQDLGLPNTGELFPDAWEFETMDIGTQFDAVEMGVNSPPEGQLFSCQSQCTPVTPAQARPTMMELLKFSGQHRTFNIPREIGIKGIRFGIFLLEDQTGASVLSMETKHRGDAEGLNIEILQEWLTGRGKQPVTWETLTNTLRDAGLTVLASDIEAVKIPPPICSAPARNFIRPGGNEGCERRYTDTTDIDVDLQASPQDARPTMMELLKFSGQHRTFSIPREIGSRSILFGTLLLEDETGASVLSMETKHRGDAEKLNFEILQEWLTGRAKQPVTWKTLTNTLRDAGLTVLASDIEAVKLYTY